jgi:hypothetical protein
VSTNSARIQDLSLNPTKLAGMCAKLKCCLNYEVDEYIEARKKLPSREIPLETQDAEYYLFKVDILRGICTYSTDRKIAANLEEITAERAREIIEMNKNGEKPLTLQSEDTVKPEKKSADLLADDDISRFDKSKHRKKKKQKAKQANAKQANENNNEGNAQGQKNNNAPKPKNHNVPKQKNNNAKPKAEGNKSPKENDKAQ